ncbi:hypothetical protein SNE40_016324 [Patella caerulea]|uniref:SMB domain-containing protein n=1 Tax=Patella caerulea TaxID=87958 RepID=A0AAN8J9Q6_PATCE
MAINIGSRVVATHSGEISSSIHPTLETSFMDYSSGYISTEITFWSTIQEEFLIDRTLLVGVTTIPEYAPDNAKSITPQPVIVADILYTSINNDNAEKAILPIIPMKEQANEDTRLTTDATFWGQSTSPIENVFSMEASSQLNKALSPSRPTWIENSKLRNDGPTTEVMVSSINNWTNTQHRSDCDSKIFPKQAKTECFKNGDFSCMDDNLSCKNRCGEVSTVQCSCNIYCHLYGTCCVDFKIVCPEMYLKAKEKFSHLKDAKIDCNLASPGYLLISTCTGNSSTYSESMCLNNTMPVSIADYHFKNIHCLRCNGFDEVESQSWTFKLYVNLKGVDKSFFEDTEAINLLPKNGIFHWIPPDISNPNLHLCSEHLVSDCPVETYVTLREKCLVNRSPVSVFENGKKTLYRNRYCADCNVKSIYVCHRATFADFLHVLQGPGRFSAAIDWTMNMNRTKVILNANRPFLWKTATCNILSEDLTILDCKMESCRHQGAVASNNCSFSGKQKCVRSNITWISQHHEATCADQICINSTFNLILERILEIFVGDLPGMFVISTHRYSTNLTFSLYLSFVFEQEVLPSTKIAQDIISLHYLAINSILVDKGFLGGTLLIKVGVGIHPHCINNAIYSNRNFTIVEPNVTRSRGSTVWVRYVSAVSLIIAIIKLYIIHNMK